MTSLDILEEQARGQIQAAVVLAMGRSDTGQERLDGYGLGWYTTGSPLPQHEILVFFEIPGNRHGQRIPFVARLVDADGQPVYDGQAHGGPALVQWASELTPLRAPGLPPGSPIQGTTAITSGGGMPLPPGRYEWLVEVEGEHKPHWRASFTVIDQ